MRAALLALVLSAGAAAALSPDLDAGAPPGAEMTARVDRAYDSYAVPVAPFGREAEPLETQFGRVIWTAHRLDDPDATTAEVIARYRTALAARGFESVLDCADTACGGFDFRFGAALLPPPAMLIDARDFAQLTMRAEDPHRHVSVLVSRVLDSVHVQTVMVQPGPPPEGDDLVPSEPAGEEDGSLVLAQDEAVLLERLRADGHVAVEGLWFETGGAAISEESGPALDRLAGILSADGDLSVVIVGHSDNQGSLEINLDLSRQRAEAVRTALIDRGVAASQVTAAGVGFLAPVTSNATAQGRNRNRRVELVLR